MRAADDLLGALRPGLRGAWERLWFAEGSLVRLGAVRIAVVSTALYGLCFHRGGLVQDDAAVSLVERRYTPVYFLDVLGVGPLAPSVAEALFPVIFAVLTLALIGLWSRVTCLLGAMGMLLWTGMAYSFGQPHHEYGTLAFALWALPFGPVGARLSIDSLRARLRAAQTAGATPWLRPDSGEGALLPIRFIQITLTSGYAFAAASKLSIGGLDWVNGYSLQHILLQFDAPFSAAVAEHLPLLTLLSLGVILIQLSAPIAVLWRPSRWVLVPAIISLHLGSRLTMDTGTFYGLWALLAVFVDWERVPQFLARWSGSPGRSRAVTLLATGVATAWFVVYLENGSFVLLIGAIPLVGAALIGLRGLPPIELAIDTDCPEDRRTAALVAAGDWCGRIELRPSGAASDPRLASIDVSSDDAYRAVAQRIPWTALAAHLPGSGGLAAALGRRLSATGRSVAGPREDKGGPAPRTG